LKIIRNPIFNSFTNLVSFNSMRKFLSICAFCLLSIGGLLAQGRTVTGVITDNANAPMPGVNITVKGTTNGTISDANGKYSIVADPGNTLVFSFIGFVSQEITVGNRSAINVSLTMDNQQLTEVVVTAGGIERQAKTLGYSTTNVRTEELNVAKALNPATGLSGKVAGLQISTVNNGVNPSTRVVLRGNRSILGNNQALIVVDGVQSQQEVLEYLNPNDIESVTVLKGANAAALYGNDASNGVLMITTKKGRNAQLKVTVSSTTQLESVSYMPKFQNRFGAGTEAYSRVYIPFENQSYGPEFDGKEVDLGKTLEDGAIQKGIYSAKPNAKRGIWDTGLTTQNDISLSGGNEKAGFYASVQDVNVKGVVPRDAYRRTGGRFNANTELGKFKASFNVSYAQATTNKTNSNFYFTALNTAANIDLSQYRNWQNFRNPDGSLNYGNPNNYFNDYFENPWFELDNQRSLLQNNNLIGTTQVDFKATSWATVTYRIGVTNRTFFSKNSEDIFKFRQYASSSTGAGISRAVDNNGNVNDYSGFYTDIVQDIFATVNKKIGEDFSVLFILGSNIKQQSSKYQYTEATALVVPGLFNVGNRTGEPVVTEVNSRTRLLGFYGDLTLGFRDFLFVHASGRRDASSLLSKDNRAFFYPGLDVSFVVTEAFPALKTGKYLDFLKITGAVSRVGTINVAPYALETTFPRGAGFPYGSTPGYSVGNTLALPGLKPEFTNSAEIGLEAGFLDRLNIELAYYKQRTTDQTLIGAVSRASGFSNSIVNLGETTNNGFEVTLRGDIIKMSSGFKWSANINYTKVNNRVTDLPNDIDLSTFYNSFQNQPNRFGSGGTNSTRTETQARVFAIAGQPYPVLKVAAYERDPATGKVVVDATTGYPVRAADLKIAGQTTPTDRLGLSTSFSYKGLTLSGLAEYRGGNVTFNGIGTDMVFTGVGKITEAYGRERFVFPNSVIKNADGTYRENTDVAVKDGGLGFWDANFRNYGENFVTSGAFWKLREVSLRYDFPQALLSKTRFIKNASIGLVGRNLLMFLPKENLYNDPEFSQNNGNAVGITNSFNTPSTRTYGFNLTVSF
jgi:TonB-linked SusC/RagA family outer membrane protein